MRHSRFLIPLALAVVAAAPGWMRSQEPAFLNNTQVLRFEESPGVYHYLYPCQSQAEFHAEMPKFDPFAPGLEHALCWLVVALKMTKVDGKYEAAPFVPGRLIVAPHNIRFMPQDAKLSDRYADFLPAGLQFSHKPGDNFALFGTTDVFFKFGFAAACPTCTPGTAVPPATDPAQLETEFALVAGSFKDFDSTFSRLQELAAQVRITVNAGNQPTASDPHDAMGIYGALNERIAALCPEPAKRCIESYARYEAACQKQASGESCPPPPACSATCNLTGTDAHALPAMYCIQPDQQAASPIPDWTPIVRPPAAAQQTGTAHASDPPPPATNPATIRMVPDSVAPPSPRAFRPGALDYQYHPETATSPPGNGCSAKASRVRAAMPGLGAVGGVIGSVFGSGTPPASGFGVAGVGGAPHKIALSAGVAQSHLIEQTAPVYPPIAKAARVSGTVVLQATISKTGLIENLRIVAGPAMLQQAALDAVSKWRYKPYLLNGEPVEVDTTVNVVFNLGGPPPAATGTPSTPPPSPAPQP